MKDDQNQDKTRISDQSADDILIAAIQQSNERAFRELFNRYYKILVAAALQVLKEQDQAKDMVQDLFFWLWKNRETLDIQSSVPGYLKRATINRCLNLLKKEQKFNDSESWEEPLNSSPTPQEIMEGEEMETKVQKALDELPERCRIVFSLKRIEGYSIKEIAEQLDISPKTVENQITKALKHLRLRLEPYLKKNNGPP